MDELIDILQIDFNWYQFILIVFILSAVYALLYFLKRIVRSVFFSRRVKFWLVNALDLIFIYYEPLAIIIGISLFVLINPLLHGLIVLLGILVGMQHFRNYFNGKIIQGKRSIELGQTIKVEDISGLIFEKGRLGLRVKSKDGLHYIPYEKLIRHGYVLSSGDKIAGLYHLNVSSLEDSKITHHRLTEVLMSSPYVDEDYKPIIHRSPSDNNILDVTLSVKEESHIFELLTMLEENDFAVEMTKP